MITVVIIKNQKEIKMTIEKYDIHQRNYLSFDVEFSSLNPETAKLLSIAIVPLTIKGSSFYAEFSDCPIDICSNFVKKNVLSNMKYINAKDAFVSIGEPDENGNYTVWMKDSTENIRRQLTRWLMNFYLRNGEKKLQFISDLANYDWSFFIKLVGSGDGDEGISLPEYIDYIYLDLTTMLYMSGIDPDITREDLLSKPVSRMLIAMGFTEKNKHNCYYDALVGMVIANDILHIIDSVDGVKYSGKGETIELVK